MKKKQELLLKNFGNYNVGIENCDRKLISMVQKSFFKGLKSIVSFISDDSGKYGELLKFYCLSTCINNFRKEQLEFII